MKFSYNICHWFALSQCLLTPEDWMAWARTDQLLPYDDTPLKLNHIPMLQARRMSIPCKLACETFLTLVAEDTIDAAVFISQHGELERSYKILANLAKEKALSPTDFSMSVHNAASGLATIIAKNTMDISSICASEDGFHQGLIEANVYFSQGARKVLVIDFDGHLPPFYKALGEQDFPAYACGYVLEQGPHIKGIVQSMDTPNNQSSSAALPQSLAFLRALLTATPNWSINGHNKLWQWSQQ